MLLKHFSSPCLRRQGDPFAWCPFCYSNVRGRSNFRGHRGYHSVGRSHVPLWSIHMKLPSSAKPRKPGTWVCCDPAFAKDYPTLAEGMCDDLWENGKDRVVWTLSMRFKEAGVLLTLNDKGLKKALYTEGESLLDALALMEDALAQGHASWRKTNW